MARDISCADQFLLQVFLMGCLLHIEHVLPLHWLTQSYEFKTGLRPFFVIWLEQHSQFFVLRGLL